MGCKAITPHLVSLASKLEGKPFHLVASHCQRDTRENVVRYLKSKGLEEDTPNFTVTSFGRHPQIKGNGYVPYYAVYDHTGKLIYHHMCGAYHGGDGLRMIEWVEQLLKDAPALYLGPEPFTEEAALAAKIQSRKGLASNLAKLEKRLQSEESEAAHAELTRIHGVLTEWRDRELDTILRSLATRPSTVVDRLSDLQKELGRTTLAAPVTEQLDGLKGSADLKDAIALEKEYRRAIAKIEKLSEREGSAKSIQKILRTLRESTEGKEHLPIAATVRDHVTTLMGG